MKRNGIFIALLLSAIALAPAHAQDSGNVYDPIEPVNRAVFGFNNVVDTYVLDPVVVGYRAAVPKPVRTGLRNFIRHLESPIWFANNLLQGDLTGAGNTLARAMINTFVGFGGIMDPAGKHGIKESPEDFGQTLAVWGMGPGPYLVLPLLGPSNLRDTGGLVVDTLADPINNYADNVDKNEIAYVRTGAKLLVVKNDIYDAQQDLKKNSADYYSAVRSAVKQKREADIRDSASDTGNAPLPDYTVE